MILVRLHDWVTWLYHIKLLIWKNKNGFCVLSWMSHTFHHWYYDPHNWCARPHVNIWSLSPVLQHQSSWSIKQKTFRLWVRIWLIYLFVGICFPGLLTLDQMSLMWPVLGLNSSTITTTLQQPYWWYDALVTFKSEFKLQCYFYLWGVSSDPLIYLSYYLMVVCPMCLQCCNHQIITNSLSCSLLKVWTNLRTYVL